MEPEVPGRHYPALCGHAGHGHVQPVVPKRERGPVSLPWLTGPLSVIARAG
jgi:hypothetical protein